MSTDRRWRRDVGLASGRDRSVAFLTDMTGQ
jgi:hypothetical protein